MKRNTRKMGGRRGKKGSRKNVKRGGSSYSTVTRALSSLESRGVRQKLVTQPDKIDWTQNFGANRYALQGAIFGMALPKKIFVYELDYNSAEKTLIIKFDKTGSAQLELKSGIKKVLKKIGIDLPDNKGYFAVGRGGATGNEYWSTANVVTFKFAAETATCSNGEILHGIDHIKITAVKDNFNLNKTISMTSESGAKDPAIIDTALFNNGFNHMKAMYNNMYLIKEKSGIPVPGTGELELVEYNGPKPVEPEGEIRPAEPTS
jgi:hypothetical protein